MESSCTSRAPAEEAAAAAAAAAGAAAALAPDLRREHMFDKVVTPSDVGKLNRLVIPKQHAERFFPLDPSLAVKGLTLAFEDAGGGGRRWCFRYSYWSSSQSYVITKGWSRFVREKQLSAGDTVSFSRGGGGGDHHCRLLFIDSKRRGRSRPKAERLCAPPSLSRFSITGPAWRSSLQMGGMQMQFESRGDAIGMRPTAAVPAEVVLDGEAKPRQLRLFGVNLEYPEPESGGNSRLSLLAGGGEQWSR